MRTKAKSTRELKARRPVFESVCVMIRRWQREYSFEINRHRWEFAPHHHHERDCVTLQGDLEVPLRRKTAHAEIHLMPSYVPREEFTDDVERIGNVWVSDGVLGCSAWIPADAYYSLVPQITQGGFPRVELRLNSLRYNRGALGMIRFLPDVYAPEAENRNSTA